MGSYDAWKSTEPQQYNDSHMPLRVLFPYHCDGLVNATKLLADDAPWFARTAVQMARKLGMYREPLDLAVVARIDVEAGEPVSEIR